MQRATARAEVCVTIGIIGAGAMGRALAKRLIAGGYTVIISNRRGPDSLEALEIELGPNARRATVEDAALTPIVVVAIPWSQLPGTLGRIPHWTDRIVIDTTNPIEPPHYTVADLGGRTSSEVVADLVPGAKLVKAFNTLTPGDRTAKAEVHAVLTSCGFAGVDLGDLAAGGRLQQFPGGPLAGLNLVRVG
jgi:predicted dinucleotide-binding enzyme